MLTVNDEQAIRTAPTAPPSGPNATSATAKTGIESVAVQTRLERMLRIEWLGQMAASLCWIASMLVYGISSGGDWLQLCAASAWLLANIAAIAAAEAA